MTTLPLRRRLTLPAFLVASFARSSRLGSALAVFTAAMAVLAVLGLVGVAFDPRQVVGAPVWAKTTKFAISLALYGATLSWMLSFVEGRPRLVRFVASAASALLGFEMVLLITQAVRGRMMHFNFATPLDAALYEAMGIAIGLFWLVNALAASLLLVQRLENRVLALGLRLGLVLSLVGFAQGALMTMPSAAQMAEMRAGGAGAVMGAHTVGAPDGGPGVPFLGWSSTHGDLRVGHFVGIHGMQVAPLLAWWLARRRERWLRQGHRLALVWTGALAYLGLVALITWQALRGQPLVAPDGLTLAALAGLLGAAGLVALGVLTHARGGSRRRPALDLA